MVEILNKPLPEDFYVAAKWHRSMMKYYCDDLKKLPRAALQRPLESLTTAIENVTYLNGNFPEDTYKLFRQAIGPLWDPQEYRDKVYKTLMDTATSHMEPRLITIADSLLYLRSLFEQDMAFIEKYFKPEIEAVDTPDATNYQEKMRELAQKLQMIVRVHVDQICKMISSRV